ncbi:MAG: hypothetical protein A2747_01455 [Candidatus Yonathbacteria bacterium RIFCSPHIGHO2_01_FULL_44_41]|uniref:Uncharacterized protein n=1 Tax=Candidatus Yonathbacteria bacterium RIFCSPHIGHO2_02_FULL_44_14 TaxID=1802724 RepID=A0A1G2S9M6_9BACT|nr:MAG: hypothetical protein A2747_01455 [Candidatus Yonathbacteria bacterium RIFCSPHIGHO2_01_FULL_44_41]OHA80971.1 MAG: hypothetical protein A3D51_03035 [Candidatus Yonathbacteria bacterium RIFCSPHIGHO2_02_FULL_44_14]OHA82404.1 MAG: hypothetical protein A3B06_00675 [Candidatus Yonathbacteria bacterium RIFCSPLOWO2_01_FULL_43_20]
MNSKKIFITLISILIIAGVVTFATYIQKGKQVAPVVELTPKDFEKMPPLPAVDELALQKQLQETITKGKKSECATITDPRYQFACHNFFIVQTKK